jgi:hypothetical protein
MGLSSLLHLISCWAMVGVIWIIQLVHYPAYRFIDASQFTQYQLFHSNQITYFVAPMMLMEFASSVWMLYLALQTRTNLTWQIVSFVLLLIIWGLTFFKIVPLHSQLQFGKDSSMIEQIIQLNWWRTILWSARSLLILKLIWKF